MSLTPSSLKSSRIAHGLRYSILVSSGTMKGSSILEDGRKVLSPTKVKRKVME